MPLETKWFPFRAFPYITIARGLICSLACESDKKCVPSWDTLTFPLLFAPIFDIISPTHKEDVSDMTDTQQKAAAKQFAKDWEGKGYEKGTASHSGSTF